MSEKGRLECESCGAWEPSTYGGDLGSYVYDWLRVRAWMVLPSGRYRRYRWVDGSAVVYLPEPQR